MTRGKSDLRVIRYFSQYLPPAGLRKKEAGYAIILSMENKKIEQRTRGEEIEKKLADENPAAFMALKRYESESKSIRSEEKIGIALIIWFVLVEGGHALTDAVVGKLHYDPYNQALQTSLIITPWWVTSLGGICFFFYGYKSMKKSRNSGSGSYDFFGLACMVLGSVLLIAAAFSASGMREMYYDFSGSRLL